MSYLPPEKKDPNKVTNTPFVQWVVVGGAGLGLVGSGLYGILTGG